MTHSTYNLINIHINVYRELNIEGHDDKSMSLLRPSSQFNTIDGAKI